VSESEERRALMLPQELKGMSQDSEIILYEGMAHPAKVGKIRYYQDGTFTKRLRKPVAVASLKGGRQ
ncbi:TPA: type IV secretory system conjugative DNA transfer family protein, partial [Neisseria oralis]